LLATTTAEPPDVVGCGPCCGARGCTWNTKGMPPSPSSSRRPGRGAGPRSPG